MRPPAFELRDVGVPLGAAGVRFTLSRPKGGVTAVMGPSGAGKSTLLNLLAGFLAPQQGEIIINNRDVTRLPPAERGVSMVFQDNNLFAHLDIRSNIGLGLDPTLRLSSADTARVDDALARVGLDGYGPRLPGTLSGGERQRVALARAFARARPLLLLDEPFDGLGPGLAADMLKLMDDIRRAVDATVVIVTHDPDEARNAADHIVFIDAGRIVADAPADGFFERTDTPALSRYLKPGHGQDAAS